MEIDETLVRRLSKMAARRGDVEPGPRRPMAPGFLGIVGAA